MMQLQGLFPVPIGFFDRPIENSELDFIKTLKKRSNIGNVTSVDNKVLCSLIDLKVWIEKCLSNYFNATVNPKYDVHLKITQSWCNYSEPGQYHHKHAHPNSYISGVYYAQTNPNDRIYFYRDGWQQIKISPNDWNVYNSESWWFDAIQGKLILFPSSLVHMVPTIDGEITRISLSFNTFLVGDIGEELDLTGLKIEA